MAKAESFLLLPVVSLMHSSNAKSPVLYHGGKKRMVAGLQANG